MTTDLSRQTPKQRAHMFYMQEAMRRLEWDLHNAIWQTDRIPEAWHEIALNKGRGRLEKVTLKLEADVLRFFRSMGAGYGPRINDVLASYMQARLAGLLRGAETTNHFRRREQEFAGPKPQWGDCAREIGEDWQDAPDGRPVLDTLKARLREQKQRLADRLEGG